MLRPVTLVCLAIGLMMDVRQAQTAVTPEARATARVESGEIAGAKFTVAVPANWNRRVLLIAHGYVPAERPLLTSFYPEQLAYRTLLKEGWLIAATSYRRNGMIVTDAMADLEALRVHLVAQFGEPDRVILLGESMGGLIVTLLCEQSSSSYAGALAIGAALAIDEGGALITPRREPQRPLLFLSNQSEVDGPAAYVDATADHVSAELRPALFRVSRDGHVNVNQLERLNAIRALDRWIDAGRSTLPTPPAKAAFFDATVGSLPVASLVTLNGQTGSFVARITDVSAAYGNVTLSAQPEDFRKAGIAPNTWFTLTAHGHDYRTFYGSDFSSVKKGEWVVFPNADGFFTLSRNYADAAGTARLAVSDEITINSLRPNR